MFPKGIIASLHVHRDYFKLKKVIIHRIICLNDWKVECIFLRISCKMICIFKLVVIKCFLSYFIIVQNRLYEADDKPKEPGLRVIAEELANY